MSQMTREPIAIVGIGCRMPGEVTSATGLFDFVAERRSGIVEVPADRWNADALYHPDFRKRGHIHVKRGGFLSSIDEFDAGFFGISFNEARRMDPQQRLLLETTYRALEDAGIPLERIAGTRTAVFVGVSAQDYEAVMGGASERRLISGTTNTGVALSIVANRLSYIFDLRGPSTIVDTACSSSLVAVHLACRSIWDGTAEGAIAGGVNLILRPESSIGFSKGGFLSPDAACRAFSDDANGYVRAEGAGVLVLKPLSAALASADRIYALIAGTSFNQDGRSAGMTVPSLDAQERLLIEAYRDAGVDPSEVSYVEAHGTGTPVGDPIEARAIGAVVGKGRRDDEPCYIGSIKTNIGHLEPASGVAGLIKLAMTLSRRTVLPNLNFRAPSPNIPFDELRLRVPTEQIALRGTGTLYGGVNSFGFGGANAHVVVTSAPVVTPRAAREDARPVPIVLSARSPAALQRLATDLADHLESGTASLESVSATLRERRSALEHRVATIARSPGEAATRLRQLGATATSPELVTGRTAVVAAPLAFVFSGQGPQWWGMGRELLQSSRVFRETVERVDRTLASLGWLRDEGSSLLAELGKDEAASRMGRTEIAQPCIFALQVGLARMLADDGIVPTAVIGHSIGELAAAEVAGILSLEEATRIVFWRSRAQAAAEDAGAMAAIGLDERSVRARLVRYAGAIEIAAFNGPDSITVAGTTAAIDALAKELDAEEVFCRKLNVSVPFHCFLMDPIEASFRAGLGAVDARDARIPFYSTVTAERVTTALDLDYWYRNIREPVSFRQGIDAMLADGLCQFIEIGPQPILSRGVEATMAKAGVTGAIVPTLKRGTDEPEAMARALTELFVRGVSPSGIAPDAPVALPPYPFERPKLWVESKASRDGRTSAPLHPLFRAIEPRNTPHRTFGVDLEFDAATETYLTEHRVQNMIVVPAATQLEAIMAAGRAAYGEAIALEGVRFQIPLVLSDEDELLVGRLEVHSDEGHFTVASRVEDRDFVVHTRGRFNTADVTRRDGDEPDFAAIQARFFGGPIAPRRGDVRMVLDLARNAGLDLGASFSGMTELAVLGDEGIGKLEVPETLEHEWDRYWLHPALLDGVLQAAGFTAGAMDPVAGLFLPHGVARCRFVRPFRGAHLWAHVRHVHQSAKSHRLDVQVFDDSFALVLELTGLELAFVHGSSSAARRSRCYELRWIEAPLEAPQSEPAHAPWLLVSTPRTDEVARALAAVMLAAGQRVVEATPTTLPENAADLAGVLDLTGLATAEPSALAARAAWARDARYVVATAGVWPVTEGERPRGTDAAVLWGLGRVLLSERPMLRLSLVDLGSTSPDATELEGLARELVDGSDECEVTLRGAGRYVSRLSPFDPPASLRRTRLEANDVRAVVESPGVLDSVVLKSLAPIAPGPLEVAVSVRATSLNFKDVVVALDMLPQSAWKNGTTGAALGMDFAGVVTAVGDDVHDVRVGDEVVGSAHHCLGNRTLASHVLVVPKPSVLSFAEAAAIPSAFLTAIVAFRFLARLQPGETVLVHAAAGGVGMAAVQIARELGARVIGTASTEEKRATARRLGAEHVFDSRTLEFRERVLEVTGGRGVDVVLNSLSGAALTQSLRCLGPYGRFVEIGKVDIYGNRQIGLEVIADNVSISCLDVNRWAWSNKKEAQTVMREALDKVARGEYERSRSHVFPIEQARDALRLLSRGAHMGKVVVETPATGEVDARPADRIALSDDATYLVTGGTRGFGLEVASFLVERGARHLVLLGRNGLRGLEEREKVAAMESAGARVRVERADVGDPDDVARVLASIEREGPPLRGIFHAAMILDDAPLGELTSARFDAVLRPKAGGAKHLDRLTRKMKLDHFVCFSSIASIVGTPGQGNYAAANAFLDALAHARRAEGLAATTINFGVLDAGVVARASEAERAKIIGQGVAAFDVSTALQLLEAALTTDRAQLVVADVDWKRIEASRPDPSRRRAWHSLAGSGTGAAHVSGSPLELVMAAPPAERAGVAARSIAELVARVSGQDETPDEDTSLSRFGLDSLMATQLHAWIETTFGVEIPLVRLLRGPTIRELGTEIVQRLEARQARDEAPAGAFEWIVRRSAPPRPRARLFCFPPMAGTGSEYTGFGEGLPADVEVCTVELPELGGSGDELLRGPVEALRAGLMAALEAHGDLPFGLYGHSMGGWIALQIARALDATRLRPAFVAVGALPTASVVASALGEVPADPDAITDAAIVLAAKKLGVPTALLDDPRASAIALRRIRRDLWIGARLRTAEAGRAIDAHLLVLGGTDDPLHTMDTEPKETLDALASRVEVHLVRGSHMFMHEPAGRSELMAHLSRQLRKLVETTPLRETEMDRA